MIGQQFGNYKALALLGEGGMGAVYMAEHPGIGRRVAVKVLHRELASDEQLLGRLLNEARAANAIRHPNIIEILDSGMRPDGVPYLVMELLEGESLGTRLRRAGRLTIRQAVDFAYQTASALGAAHKKGIVHRDLKPDNLFVVPDDDDPNRERIKVLDFGIAKLQQPQPGDSVKTRTGTLMGTPIYMSPEQCRGTRTVDHRSDIYALGVILFEMLTGQPPFVSEGFGELVHMHLNVPAPSARTLRPELPPALDALLLKMLAKNPEDRYADMTALQGTLKLAGGSQFDVRGSSPDIMNAPTRPEPTVDEPPRRPTVRDTTLTTGVGEREAAPRRKGGSRLVVGGVAAAAVAAAALWWLRGGAPAPAPAVTTTSAMTPPPALTAPPRPERPAPPVAPKQVTVRVTSNPVGATVVEEGAGTVLGVTPLALTRPRGGALKLRFEKDGYAPAARALTLDEDQSFELALDKRAKPKGPKGGAHKARSDHERADEEPAKL